MEWNELLWRYIKGLASPEEKKRVILWLEESPGNIKEYLALRKLYDLQTWNSDKDIYKKKSSTAYSFKRASLEIAKVAAIISIAILSTIYFLAKEDETTTMQTIKVPIGQRVEVILNDGSEVWLNSGSTFSFPDKFTKSSRHVILDGEGFFTVARQEKTPFIVSTPLYNIEVLGTEFNVTAYGKKNNFETSLLKGSIEVYSPGQSERIRLQPDERLYLTENGLKKESISDYSYFKWTEGLLSFENETAASLFAKLELYYDVQIVVKNKSILDFRYTGKFRIRDGVEHVMRVLQVKHKFTYTQNEDNSLIVIE